MKNVVYSTLGVLWLLTLGGYGVFLWVQLFIGNGGKYLNRVLPINEVIMGGVLIGVFFLYLDRKYLLRKIKSLINKI